MILMGVNYISLKKKNIYDCFGFDVQLRDLNVLKKNFLCRTIKKVKYNFKKLKKKSLHGDLFW